MTSTAKNEKALIELIALLRKNLVTATEISIRTGCSKPVAYKRIKTLRKRGLPFQIRRVRQGVSGPKSIAYTISGESK